MWWVFFRCAVGVLASVIAVIIFSMNAQAWSADAPPDFLLSETKVADVRICSGVTENIFIDGQRYADACIMGNQTRVASYVSRQGHYAYAISFPFDNNFYQLDICGWMWGCVYTEENDTFAVYFSIYKDFSKSVTKVVENGTVRYKPPRDPISLSVPIPNNRLFNVNSFAVSSNGKWFVVEITGLGYFRVNPETQEVRRVIAPGSSYGFGSDPAPELAISNDGKTVAVMGTRLAVSVVMVDDFCGDTPSETMPTSFGSTTTPCRYVPVPYYEYIKPFSYAQRPRFSSDNSTLSFDVRSNLGDRRHVTLFSDASVGELSTYYLAIGDSFTSGEGEVDDSFYIGGATNKCHVSSRSYPYLLGRAWGGASRHNAACSGATIETARATSNRNNQPNQLSQIETRLPKVLTVGIGGNDAGLMGKLKSCIGLDTCEWAQSADKRQSTADEIKNLYPKLKHFYQQLKSVSPGKIIVVGYPKIISSEPLCLADVGVLLNQTERQFMNEGIHYLNQVIQAAAGDSDIEYVDTENVFRGTELCSLGIAPSMNGIRVGEEYPVIEALSRFKIIGAESFHPTPTGHEKVKEAILGSFPTVDIPPECVTCRPKGFAPLPGSYWDGAQVAALPRFALPFIDETVVKKGNSFKISLPPLSFKALAEIQVQMHSEIKDLGGITSTNDGAINVTVSTKDLEPGFHSLHLTGKNSVGNDVEVYDFFTIEQVGDTPPQAMPLNNTNDNLVVMQNNPQSVSGSNDEVAQQENDAGVLGLSVTPLALDNSTEQSRAGMNTVQPEKLLGSDAGLKGSVVLGILAIILGLGAIFAIVVGIYVFHRRKRPRNPDE